MTPGERIRIRREELGLTQDELAKRIGYSNRSGICRLEKAETITIKMAEKVAKALDMPTTELLHFEQPKLKVVFDSTRDIYAMRIAEKAAQLSTEQQHQVMDFINYLKGKNK